MNNPFQSLKTEDLPAALPVFPLPGVLLLPRGHLPLNIFEPRYIKMVDDAMASHRLIGMIQPRDPRIESRDETLFSTGCAGLITDFSATEDGRYEIVLQGISRFAAAAELDSSPHGYRRFNAGWDSFAQDLSPVDQFNLDRARLKLLLRDYFSIKGMDCDLDSLDTVSDDNLITCLSMVCPLDASEKQALLEARCSRTRSELFMTLLDMVTRDTARKCSQGSKYH